MWLIAQAVVSHEAQLEVSIKFCVVQKSKRNIEFKYEILSPLPKKKFQERTVNQERCTRAWNLKKFQVTYWWLSEKIWLPNAKMQLPGSTKAETQIRASLNWHCCLASTLKFMFFRILILSQWICKTGIFFLILRVNSLKCKDQDFCFKIFILSNESSLV